MLTNVLAIIFDYGGTLDSRGDHWSEVIRRAYEAEGLNIPREAFRDAYVYAERALDGTGIITPDDNFLALMRKKIALQFTRLDIDDTPLAEAIAVRCYESARECVRESRETLARLAEYYPLGIVSNFYGNVRAVLDDFGLTPLLTAVIDSTAIGIRKPDPAIFATGITAINNHLEAPGLHSTGKALDATPINGTGHNSTEKAPDTPCTLLPSQVLVVGDSIDKDILPAASLGCRTALIEGTPWDATRPQPSLPADTIRLTHLSDLITLLPQR